MKLILLMLLFSWNASAQYMSVNGRVTDENNNPIVGANIAIREISKLTISDENGEFALNSLPAGSYKLRISSVGYKTVFLDVEPDQSVGLYHIRMKENIQNLREVEIIHNENDTRKSGISTPIQIIEEEFLKENQSGSLIQTLEKIPGIHSMDIGHGLSKPMIRGLGYYRVAVAQSGIRHEGQQWCDHYGLAFDQHQADHIEIIKGPATLRFGPDALGGVINILPAHIPIKQGISGDISAHAATNPEQWGISATISGRKNSYYFHATLSTEEFGDIKVPQTETYILPAPVSLAEASHKVSLGDYILNTSGRGEGASVVAGLVRPWGNTSIELDYYSHTGGFFDWTGLRSDSLRSIHESSFRDIQLPYQQVGNISLMQRTNIFFNENKLQLVLGYQSNHISEHTLITDLTGNRASDLLKYKDLDLDLQLQTFSGNLEYHLNSPEKYSMIFGLNTQYQDHSKGGFNHILPDYQRFSGGLFITANYTLTDKIDLNTGFRLDYFKLLLEESLNPDPELGDSVLNSYFNESFPGLSFSAGICYQPAENTLLKFNIGRTHRVPSAYELAAYGLHRHEGRFEKGNLSNQSEKAWQFDLEMENEWQFANVSISPFLNYFDNYLYLRPTPVLRPEGQVYEYTQNKALLTGSELSVSATLLRQVNIHLGAEYVYAVNLDQKSALPFTPPFSLLSEIQYRFKDRRLFKHNKLGIQMLWVMAQNYTVPNELSTPGYLTFGLFGQTDIQVGKQEIDLIVRVENLFNNKYFDHTSFYRRLRIPEAGRNFQLQIYIPF